MAKFKNLKLSSPNPRLFVFQLNDYGTFANDTKNNILKSLQNCKMFLTDKRKYVQNFLPDIGKKIFLQT